MKNKKTYSPTFENTFHYIRYNEETQTVTQHGFFNNKNITLCYWYQGNKKGFGLMKNKF